MLQYKAVHSKVCLVVSIQNSFKVATGGDSEKGAVSANKEACSSCCN